MFCTIHFAHRDLNQQGELNFPGLVGLRSYLILSDDFEDFDTKESFRCSDVDVAFATMVVLGSFVSKKNIFVKTTT